ncbi:Uncharacterised protein [Klebsiella pneumoniae]|nr:Uncharacterised protein [Klebsiella pneumoniae]
MVKNGFSLSDQTLVGMVVMITLLFGTLEKVGNDRTKS